MVADVYSSSYLEGGDRRMWFKANLGKKKLARSSLKEQMGHAGIPAVIPATREVQVGRSWSKDSPGKKHKTLSEKNN
jgi:hypothetical protein